MFHCVNGSDRTWTSNHYILWFGQQGTIALLAYGNSLEDALDACVDWLKEAKPGFLCTDEVAEEYNHLISQGIPEDDAWDEAQVDTTCAGNAGDYIRSSEWGILAENPSRGEIKYLLQRYW